MRQNNTAIITKNALIAAVYVVLTMVLRPISFGLVQFRIAEALAVLPFYSLNSAAGLFVGCFVSNILGWNGILDVILGSLGTLLAGVLTYYIGRKTNSKLLALIPPVAVNAVFVGTVLAVAAGYNFFLAVLLVAVGQTVVCYGLGIPLMLVIEKYTNGDRGGFLY
ncbi:MAG: QueT transporter family protein [Christensenellales bacterium]